MSPSPSHVITMTVPPSPTASELLFVAAVFGCAGIAWWWFIGRHRDI
jgi:hypothetical protein